MNHGLLELAFVSLVSLLCRTFSLAESSMLSDGVKTKQSLKMSQTVIKTC